VRPQQSSKGKLRYPAQARHALFVSALEARSIKTATLVFEAFARMRLNLDKQHGLFNAG
jgi:hypothetical protein